MHRHTTGPWKIERWEDGSIRWIKRDMPEGERDSHLNVVIFNCETPEGESGITEADAHLCAASPDLLKAVRLLLSRIPKGKRLSDDAAAVAREAVYRATGEVLD